MGLEDADLVDDGYVGGKAAVSVSCSICLEVVTDNGDRSWAKLQCGHEFHLDCIGSAFNVKGVMQCPNCRKIEKGQWLYANGCKPYHEFSVDEWDHDVDLYDLSYPETSMWCPFGGFTRLTASFDDGEFATTAYHDVVGQHAILTEHASATHLCPYITYVHPSSSSSSSTSSATANVGDNQWNNSSQSDQMPNSYAMDVRYHTLFPTSTDQPQPPRRPLRNISHMPRSTSYVHPFLLAQSSGGRAPGSSMMHPYPGSAARARERSQALQAYFQQPTGLRAPPMVSGSRRSTGQAQAQMGPSSDQIRGIYYLPTSTGRSGPAFQEPETSIPNPWERDSHPGVGWGFHPGQGQGGSMFWQRHGSERNSSHGHYWS